MNLLLITLAILTAPPAAPIDVPTGEPPAIEAVTVFRCDFDDEADKNFDTWPDRWTRRRGPGFPLFVPVKIASEPAANQQPARNFLRIDLDGGAAAIYSPPIPVSSVFSYRLEGELRTLNLKHDVAYYSLTFFDPDGRVLETHESTYHHDTRPWTRIDVGPIAPTNPDCYTAVVGLHLRPRGGAQSDLRGSAQFASITVSRLPRVVLRCQQKHHIHTQAEQVELLCDVSGVLRPDPLVAFTLRDVEGKLLASHETQLAALPSVSNHIDNTRVADGQGAARLQAEITARDEPAQVRGFAGRARWKPPVPGPGFYRVQVAMRESDASELQRETTFVVARPLSAATAGEFGWSLPQGDERMSLADLVPLVGQAGIHWLKFPMWFSADDAARPDRLAWLADRTGMQHIELIGVLDTPPEALRKSLGEQGKLPIATAFVEAPFWQPAVDPVMSRLSLKVRYWQLGADTDTSFVGFPQLEQKITEIKRHFLKYGQEVQVGFVWPWLHEPPAEKAAWDFLTRTTQPALTASETAAYLQGDQPLAPTTQRWTTLEPLSRKHYSLETRARDLLERMLAAKINRAQGIFLPDPFSPQHGVVQADGTPDELLLPWRTTATLLGGAEYLGSIHLPGGSVNHLFRRDQQAIMVLWNDRPTQETLFLGEQIEHFDLWGRTIPHATVDQDGAPTQQLTIGRLPSFVTGLSLPIAQWRIRFAFETTHLPSVFGRDQLAKFTFINTFAQSVGGEVRVNPPLNWEVTPITTNFRAAAGEPRHESFQVRFKSEAESGRQLLRFDLTLTADHDYRFSVYQPIHVGLDDVTIETATRLNDQGELVVEQIINNRTDEFVSFNCLLFAPGRRRERLQVLELGRGRHVSSFALPRGSELIGQPLQLRAEEMNGDRVLNYRVLPVE